MRIVKFVFIFLALTIAGYNQTYASDEHWSATASSAEENYAPELAIDGDLTTRWSSEFSDNQWWMVDFDKPMEINKITLYWEAAYTKNYKILVSSDATSWKEIYTTHNGKGGPEVINVGPLTTRYVKLMLGERATKWGHSLWEVKFNEPAPGKTTVMASSGDGDYAPDRALDGTMATRWSSNFDDNQWWQVNFEKPRNLCGITIHWETAYGEKYDIQVAGENGVWKTVYETSDGDGNTDIIYFRPTEVKSLRFNGIQRGTGWGFSFWEIDFQDGNNPPVLSASSSQEKGGAELAMDGNKTTAWHNFQEAQSQITVKLPRRHELGGLILTWGEDYAVSYTVELSSGDEKWKQVYETTKGNGKMDWIFFPATRTRQVRINCRKSAAGKGYALADIELKSGEEQATPIKIFQAAAKDSSPGLYPMWLRRIQEFWTVIGVINDSEESLLSETGIFEPYKGGFSAMPFVYDGKRLYTSQDCKLSQSLVENSLPLPSVRWNHSDWNLEISALAFGKAGLSNSAVRYQFHNTGKKKFKGKLALAILPVQLNPIWQRGGLSPINRVDCTDKNGVSLVRINDQRRLISATKPAKMGAVSTSVADMDVIDFIKRGTLPEQLSAKDSQGLASCGLIYDLEISPGSIKDIVVIFPLHQRSPLPQEAMKNPGKFFNTQLKLAQKQWSKLLNRFTIDIPEERLIEVMKSNIGYILINQDGPWIKPGPRNYNHSWMRDGAMTSVALLRMGFIKEVRNWLDAVSPHVAESGFVPYIFFEGGNPVGFNPDKSGEGHEYDSQGEFVFAVRQYVDYTGDTAFLQGIYPKVVRALRFAQQLRRQRMTPEYKNDPKKQAYYGILPQSNSHEGYFPAMHSYWDDFWVLRGFKDGVHLARLAGKKDDVKWMQEEVEDFRQCIYESIRNVIARNKINYIPGCVEKGDFDSTSTAIAIMACGEEKYLPQPYLKNTFNRYYREFKSRLKPGGEATFTPYEVRSADAFIRLGERDRALTMLRYFVKDSVRPYGWNHMAEVVHAKPRASSYIGDMPHTWVGSGYISAVRTIFVYELEGQLILAAGIDPAWLDEGVVVQNLPTLYGEIDYSIKRRDDIIEFNINGKAKPPAGFVIPLPAEFKDYQVAINGNPVLIKDTKIYFSKLPAVINIYRKTPHALELENFNQPSGINCLRGSSGTWKKRNAKIKSSYIFKTTEPDNTKGREGTFLKIDYNVSGVNQESGFWSSLKNQDISGYKNLTFWIKGKEGKEKVFVGIKDSSWFEHRLSIDDYLSKGVTAGWQKVVIPLEDFSDVYDWTSMDNFSITFHNSYGLPFKGTIYVDDFQLKGTKPKAAPPPRLVYESLPSEKLTDKELLEVVQKAAFYFFWNEADPKTGLIKDRCKAFTKADFPAASIASVGFGLTAICLADNKGWISHEKAYERVFNTLKFLKDGVENEHGFYYHMINMKDYSRWDDIELSSIDTALLLAGVIFAGEYFKETEIKKLADEIYERVDWPWMLNRGKTLSMGWKPESGFLPYHWSHYNELMILYILAIGSPTHPIPAECWRAWQRAPLHHYKGCKFFGATALFTHQYSHIWVDFRNKNDRFADYFKNSIMATKANRQWCIDNSKKSKTYGPDSWGLTACDGPDGYKAYGAPYGTNDGTVAPTASIGSFVFTPKLSMSAIRYMYENYKDRIWGRYGFVDSYNWDRNWVATYYIGIDQGPIVLMIENHHSGFVWKYFMQNKHIQRAMNLCGF